MRETYPAAERKYKWLPTLLDTFAIADEGVSETREHNQAQGTPIACAAGCSACCKNPTVPFTKPEMQGISWYASEVLDGEIRSRVTERLQNHASTTECPFLVDDRCSIYPVRPLICRQYMVRGQQCEVGENVNDDRPGDVVMPPRRSIQKVAVSLLQFWDFPTRKAKIAAFEGGFIGLQAKDMHRYDWKEMAKLVTAFNTMPRTVK